MIIASMITANQVLRQRLFTSSGTFVVPDDVQVIWVDGAGGGSGGGGGNSTPGGGGGGGCCAFVVQNEPMEVTPGETLTITVGSGGPGGAADQDGVQGGKTSVVGTKTLFISDDSILGGIKGGNPNGGHSGRGGWYFEITNGGAGGGSAAPDTYYVAKTSTSAVTFPNYMTKFRYSLPGSGGALGFNGGAGRIVSGQVNNIASAIGGSNGGGGGAGGSTLYGNGGIGGSNGAAGGHATGYGAGGGGGSGNSAGGNGSSGFVRIYYLSKYPVG